MTHLRKSGKEQRAALVRRQQHKKKKNVGGLMSVVLAFVVLVGFGLFYVSQVNTVATSGLAMKDLERTLGRLEQETQELELHAAALRSLSTVEQSSKDLDLLVKAKVDYLPALSETVARGE